MDDPAGPGPRSQGRLRRAPRRQEPGRGALSRRAQGAVHLFRRFQPRLFAFSKNKPLAKELLKYLGGLEAQVRYAQTSGMLPALRAAWNAPEFQQNPLLRTFIQAAQFGRTYPSLAGWGGVENLAVQHLGMAWDLVAQASSPVRP